MTNKIIKLNDVETLADIERGFVKVKLDTRKLQQQLQTTKKCLLKASQSDRVVEHMAKFVIDKAVEADLIPRKELYKLRTNRKSIKKLVDDKGNLVRYKRGQHKGEPKYVPFTPERYFSRVEIKDDGLKEAIGEDTTKRTWKETSKHVLKETIVKKVKHEYRGVQAVTTETTHNTIVGKKHTRKKTSGEGFVVTGYRSVSNPLNKKYKRVYWQQVEGNPVYKESFTKQGSRYYTDWTPHLADTDKTHIITIKNHIAGIRINVRKPKDDRFAVEGGRPYAFYQYYTEDASWKRENENASGRWLELAVGLPVTGEYKKLSIPEGDKNYKDMVSIMETEINATLKANGVPVK